MAGNTRSIIGRSFVSRDDKKWGGKLRPRGVVLFGLHGRSVEFGMRPAALLGGNTHGYFLSARLCVG